MKHTLKTASLALCLSALLAGQSALAETPPDATAPGKQKPTGAAPKKCDRWEGKEQRLETLKADLKLTASQEAAWTEWAGKFQGDRKGREEKRKDFESLESLPAPERLEKALAFSKEHVARQEVRLAATKAFYAVLSPEQRQVFDKGLSVGPHGGFGKRWQK